MSRYPAVPFRYRVALGGALMLLAGSAPAQAPDAGSAPMAAPASSPAVAEPGSAREADLQRYFSAGLLADGFLQMGPEAAPFLAWFTPAATASVRGSLLVIPAPGRFIGHDPTVAAYMRVFPAGGWNVLAVQTPLLSAVSTRQQYLDTRPAALTRLREGIAWLAERKQATIVVAAMDGGAELALALAGEARAGITAVAAVGRWEAELRAGSVPVLDLGAERDRRAMAQAEARQRLVRTAGIENYRHYAIAGADRRYLGFADDIARRVRGWAEHLPAGRTLAHSP